MATTEQQPYHHGDLPRALLGAVGELLAESGLEGLSLRGVARRAGVSHAAPAHHFGDLGGLLAAHVATSFDAFHADLRAAVAALPPEASAADAFRAMGEGYLAFAFARPAQYGVMFRPEKVDCTAPVLVAAGGRALAAVLAVSRACLAPGSSDARVTSVALAGWSTVHGVVSLATDMPVEDVDHMPDIAQFAAPVLDVLTAGLRVQPDWVGDDVLASTIPADLSDPLVAAG